MVLERPFGQRTSRAREGGGFTLLELLVAIAVMSVAVWVFFSFYDSALGLNRTSLYRGMATRIAQDELGAIQHAPAKFTWTLPATANTELFPITTGADQPVAGNEAELPAAMPVELNALQKQQNLHGKFRWAAFGRLPADDAQHYEVTVVVHWVEGGRPQSVALTSGVPRYVVGGNA